MISIMDGIGGSNNKMKKHGLMKVEAYLRFIAFCLLLLAALLMSTDSQTIVLFQVITKTITFKVSKILVSSVYVYSIGAGYSIAQLARCLLTSQKDDEVEELTRSTLILKWISFFLDQMVAYVLFATNSGSVEFAVLAIAGAESLQWMKLCNKFTRLCSQFGASVAFAFIGFIILVVISGISAFNLFRWYSPARFLSIKRQSLRNLVGAS